MKGPKAPNPYETAAAQTQSNQSTSISQQLLNMINQRGPYGNLDYTQTGTRKYYDPILKKDVEMPAYTQTTTLSPEQQKLFEQQQQFDGQFNDIALRQTGKIGSMLDTPFEYEAGDHEAWASGLYDKLNGDNIQSQQSQMAQKLANQGLQPGTPAYDDAMRNMSYSQDKSRNDFMLGSYNQGFQKKLTERNQPINEILALMGGGQVSQPQFGGTPQTGMNGVDLAGLINSNYQNKSNQYNSMMGGLFGLGGAAMGGLFGLSDKRSKQNIKTVGKLNDGTKLYSYEYKPEVGGKKGLMHIGVMAQEVEKTHPDAVVTGDHGYKMVNYGKIAEELAA